jgi:3-hydroxybutyryl-CoA dehydrogenase
MKILVVGNAARYKELEARLPATASVEHREEPGSDLDNFDLIFDLHLDDNPENLVGYRDFGGTLIGGAVKQQLAEVRAMDPEVSSQLIGMNTLPTFLGREVAEWSLPANTPEELAVDIAKALKWDYQLVQDRVGMATPRIIMMIINEACYTLQEGTATVSDIDKAMKLGTAYPYGPFEWADRVGIDEVCETLQAIYLDTNDERYRVCPLLKTMYFEGKTFYPQ